MATAEVSFGSISFASKKRSRRPQFPKSPIYRGAPPPRPPDNGIFGLNRAQTLGIFGGAAIGVAGIATAIFRPWERQEKSESLDSKIVENAHREVLQLDTYTPNLRQKMVNFWLQGENSVVEYTTKDNQVYYFTYSPAKADRNLTDLAMTTITLNRKTQSNGGSSLVFSFAGSYNPALEESSPQLIKSSMKNMNFEHEGIVSIAAITGLISIGKDLGLDFRPNSQPVPQESYKLTQLKNYIPVVYAYAEAVAETNDYILSYPFFDKNLQGKIIFVNYQGYQDPLVGGKAFLEGGLTYIVDQTIGGGLGGIVNFDQLTQRYSTLDNIPGSSEYLRRIRQHFQTKK